MSATPGEQSASKKRSRHSSSPQLEYKKIKQYLSISSSEGESFTEELSEIPEGELMTENMGDKTLTERKFVALIADLKKEMIEEMEYKIKRIVTEIVQQRVEDIEVRMDQLEAENVGLKEEIRSLKDSMGDSTVALKISREAKTHAVENEQYSRKNSLRIFGIKETEGENPLQLVLEVLEEKLNINFTRRDFSTAHRVGKKDPGKPRAILTVFLRSDDRKATVRARKALKGTGITIVEDLASGVWQLFNRVKNDERVESAWTWEGKVKLKTKRDNKVYTIKHGQRLEDVITRS